MRVKCHKDYSYLRKLQLIVVAAMFCLCYAVHADESNDHDGDVKDRSLADKLFCYSVMGLLR